MRSGQRWVLFIEGRRGNEERDREKAQSTSDLTDKLDGEKEGGRLGSRAWWQFSIVSELRGMWAVYWEFHHHYPYLTAANAQFFACGAATTIHALLPRVYVPANYVF